MTHIRASNVPSSASFLTNGAILIASGLVPKTESMRNLPLSISTEEDVSKKNPFRLCFITRVQFFVIF